MWAFDFTPATDPQTGRPVTYDGDDLVGGITVEPRHYTCTIKIRSPGKEDIVKAAVEKDSADFLDSQTGQWRKTPEEMAFSTWVPEDAKF